MLMMLPYMQDWIYWGESGDHSVYKIHKSQKARDDENAVNLVVNGVTQPTDVIVYHGLQQPQGVFASYRNLFVVSEQLAVQFVNARRTHYLTAIRMASACQDVHVIDTAVRRNGQKQKKNPLINNIPA